MLEAVAGSIPFGVVGIFHLLANSSSTMTLGSAQPLTQMSTRDICCEGKGGRCEELTTLTPSLSDCPEIVTVLNSWNPKSLYRNLNGWLDNAYRNEGAGAKSEHSMNK